MLSPKSKKDICISMSSVSLDLKSIRDHAVKLSLFLHFFFFLPKQNYLVIFLYFWSNYKKLPFANWYSGKVYPSSIIFQKFVFIDSSWRLRLNIEVIQKGGSFWPSGQRDYKASWDTRKALGMGTYRAEWLPALLHLKEVY